MNAEEYPLEDYQHWLRDRERYKQDTIVQYCAPARRLKRFVTTGELTLGDFRDWIRSMREEGLSPSTINTYYSMARKYLDFVGVDFDPSHAVGELPEYDPDSLPDPLSVEEVASMREACEDPEEKAIIVLLYHTALRNSEIRSIKWEHVDVDAEELVVMRRKKKGWGRDTLPIYNDQIQTIQALRDWRDDDNPYLFPARPTPDHPDSERPDPEPSGKMSPGTLRNRVSAITERSGVERHVWPHLFRHTRATHMLRESGELDYVNQWCDHQNYETTMRYARLTGADLRDNRAADAANIFD